MFFQDARDNLLKELIDFNSRDDFDRFMANVENAYYDKVAPVSKIPYEEDNSPMYPPRPYPEFDHRSHSRSPIRDTRSAMDTTKNFDRILDQINTLNQRRQVDSRDVRSEIGMYREKKREPSLKDEAFSKREKL